jgi:uncharacterized protein Usg
MKFLTFWRDKLDGALYSVQVAHEKLIRPAEIRAVSFELRLH